MAKNVVKVLSLVMLAALLSGCVDLFAVPGVAVSPDGSTIYFLGGSSADVSGESDSTLGDGRFMLAPLNGEATEVGQGFGAFAVNPINGDVAYTGGTAVEGQAPEATIQLISGGQVNTLLTAESFGGEIIIPTHMAFSPDGSKLAFTAVQAPASSAYFNSDSDELDPTQLADVKGTVYLVDVASGSATLISDPATTWANVLAWSPDSATLAYNGWLDSNGDGRIDTSGGLLSMDSMMGGMMGAFGTEPTAEPVASIDSSQLHLYSVASGTTQVIASASNDYAPSFVDNNRLAYLTYVADPMMAMMGSSAGSGGIMVYDIAAGTSTTAYSTADFVGGVALSPDSSKVAWTQLGTDTATGESIGYLYVSDPTFTNPQQFNLGADFALIDAPVWLPDNSGVLITSTSIFASLMGEMMSGMMGAFSGMDMGEEATEAIEEIPVPGVKKVDLASGEVSQVYQGVLMNSGFSASVISMVAGGGDSFDFGE